jgi:hypothetical protein
MKQSEMDHLVKMANDIAANLSFQAGADDRIADHINRFWTPRMRRLLVDYAGAPDTRIPPALSGAIGKIRCD